MIFLEYGQRVIYKEKVMITSVTGTGKKVLVLLPGLGSPSPVIEFKALSKFLESSYTLVTIDYFGYGLSDRTDDVRSLENITDEVHYALESMGYNTYTLVAHSISGIYCMYYANKYPTEVEAFIGIDSFVPQQINDRGLMDKNLRMLERHRKKSDSRFFKKKIRRESEMMLRSIKDYQYSEHDINTYAGLAVEHLDSETAINELMNSDENFNRLKDVHFPLCIPILFLIADMTTKLISEWIHWHEELLGKNKGKIVVLHGSHYLHLIRPMKLADEIGKFIAAMQNDYKE